MHESKPLISDSCKLLYLLVLVPVVCCLIVKTGLAGLKITSNTQLTVQPFKTFNLSQKYQAPTFGTALIRPTATKKLESLNYKLNKYTSMNSVKNSARSILPEFHNVTTAATKILSKQQNFVYLQILNSFYLELTKNWICKASSIQGVLEQTLFVTTDWESFKVLTDFKHLISKHDRSSSKNQNPKIQNSKSYTVVFQSTHQKTKELRYGEKKYYQFMLFRTDLVYKLLQKQVSIFLVESDSTWYSNPETYLNHFDANVDIIAGQDGDLTANAIEGGFIFLRASIHTIQIWKLLKSILERNWKGKLLETGVTTQLNEMAVLNGILKDKNNDWCEWAFFPKEKFVSGRWYRGGSFKFTDPVVIQNNWIVGNYNKERRARLWGQWFLDEDGGNCLDSAKFDKHAKFRNCTGFVC